MYKAIIFDFFDVIHADQFNGWLRSIGRVRVGALYQAGTDLDSGKINIDEFFRRLSEASSQSVKEIKAEFDRHTAVNYDLLELIGKLKTHYKIGLLSNADRHYLRELLRIHKMEPLFHHIVISSEVGMIKPSPDIFQYILDKLDVSAAESLFIDDNPKNVSAAEALGLRSILYKSTEDLVQGLSALGIET